MDKDVPITEEPVADQPVQKRLFPLRLYHLPLILGLLLLVFLGYVAYLSFERRPTIVTNTEKIAAKGAPNIILILTDDQRADTLQYMPHVEQLLASQGVTFTHAFATTPLCCPSRASILTGLYAHNTHVWTNKSPNGGYPVFKDTDTLAVWMQQAGYRTGLVGKYLNEYTTTKVPPGWDSWYARTKNTYYGYTLNENGKMVEYGFDPSEYSTEVYGNLAVKFIKGTAGTVNGAPASDKKEKNIKVKKEKKGVSSLIPLVQAQETVEKPYFLMVAVDAPHTDGGRSSAKQSKAVADPDLPAVRLKQQRDQTQNEDDDEDISTDGQDGLTTHVVKDYYAMPAESDRSDCEGITVTGDPAFAEPNITDKSLWLRAIPAWNAQDTTRMTRFATSQVCSLQAVDRMVKQIVDAVGAERDNTVIIFASDNGYSWGEHRWSAKNCLYDPCTRVPLIISYPKITKTQATANTFADLIDIPVTIASLAQATMPNKLNGVSLIPALMDQTATVRDEVLIELRNSKNRPKGEDYALRNTEYLYAELSSGERELYDLKTDPNQLQNVLSVKSASVSAQPIIQDLSAKLAELKSQ